MAWSLSRPQRVYRIAGEILSVRARISKPAPAVTPMCEGAFALRLPVVRNEGPATRNGRMRSPGQRCLTSTGNCQVTTGFGEIECWEPSANTAAMWPSSCRKIAFASSDRRGARSISSTPPPSRSFEDDQVRMGRAAGELCRITSGKPPVRLPPPMMPAVMLCARAWGTGVSKAASSRHRRSDRSAERTLSRRAGLQRGFPGARRRNGIMRFWPR